MKAVSPAQHLVYTAAMKMTLLRITMILSVCFAAAPIAIVPVFGQTEEPPKRVPRTFAAPLYDDKLMRLAQILGSLQYLRSLCASSEETVWRETMEKLLDAETSDDSSRREKLTAGYNRGFRAFAAVHTSCSDTAIAAEANYRREGEALTADILARYGN